MLRDLAIHSVETRGNGLLIHFDGDLRIYAQNPLHRRWAVCNGYRFPKTTRQLRLAIHDARGSALRYGASEIDVLTPVPVIARTRPRPLRS